jgi:hypothetical protein
VADFTFNVALGREIEFHNRVNDNDPTNSALILVVLALAGLGTDADLKDADTLSAVLGALSDEVTNTGYARKTLTDADIVAPTVDDTRDRVTVVIPVQTFTSIAVGATWAKILVCYDSDTTGGTDANIIPVTAHDLRYLNSPIVPNGSNIVVDLSAGYARAQ